MVRTSHTAQGNSVTNQHKIKCYSGVHDHSESHCFMKMLEGQLKETLFAWPLDPNLEQPLNVTDTNIYKKDEVAYICGKQHISKFVLKF